MKYLILSLTIAICFSLKAQISEYNYNRNYYYYASDIEPIRYKPEKAMKQIDFTVTKGNQVKKYYKKYNEKGKLLEYAKIDDEGKATPLYQYVYNDDFRRTKEIRLKKGQPLFTTYYSYAKLGEPSEVKMVKNEKKQKFRSTYAYNENDCISGSEYFNGKDKLKKKWVYTYFEKCDRSMTMQYNGKGKLLNTWTYACKEDGEKLKAKKNKTQVCKWDESDGKYLVKIYQSMDEDGRMMKHVSKYTIQDTLIVESKSYNHQEELVYHVTYDKSFRIPLKSISYRSQKPKFVREYTYDGDQILSDQFSENGKLKYSNHYVYENGLLTEFRKQNGQGKSKKIVQLSYGEAW